MTLSTSPYGGTTAVALIPHTIVLPPAELGLDVRHSAGELTGGPGVPELQSGDAFVLTGRTTAAWSTSSDERDERAEPSPSGQLTSSPRDLTPSPRVPGPLGTVSPIGAAASASAGRSLDLGAPFDAGGSYDHDSRPGYDSRHGYDSPVDTGDSTSAIAAALSPAGLPVRSSTPEPASRPPAGPPTLGNSPAFPDLPTLGGQGRGPADSHDPGRSADLGGLPSRGGPPPGLGSLPDRSGSSGPTSQADRGGSFGTSGLPSRSPVPGSDGLPPRGPFTPGGQADPGTSAPSPGGRGPSLPTRSAAAGTYRGLPRRVRQANLSPHLVNTSATDTPEPMLSPAPVPIPPDRTPEEARAFVASFRTGWQRDEDADDGNTPRDEDRADTLGIPADNGARVTEQQDSAASQIEER